jgi:NAD(P)-dependent dehydrogenase (short-subunit alcohol dehydrogenase family)
MTPRSASASNAASSKKKAATRTPAKRATPSSVRGSKQAVPANRTRPAERSTTRTLRPKRNAALRADRLGSPNTGVLITGGGSGIGRETALALAEVGRPVAIWDVNAEGAEEVAALCSGRYGVASMWADVDVADSSAVAEGVPDAVSALGSIGGFVHAAGVPGPMPVDFIDDDVWDATINVNLRAAAMISKALLEPLRAAGPGSAVVLISSIEGLFGSAMLTAYCASKAGVLGVMRSIGHRFAAEGIRVNAVCPGAVATPMLLPAFDLPGFRERLEERTPLGRVSTPDEIARPIRFLLSDEASFITGTHLTIDGGLTSVTTV